MACCKRRIAGAPTWARPAGRCTASDTSIIRTWGNEGDFQGHNLPSAAYRIDGRYRRDRHRHPWFVLCNNATGEHFIGQLAWSGGYSFEFDLSADRTDPAAHLFFRGGPDAPSPQRVIAPGESVRTPEMHLGLTFDGIDAAIHAMHDHLRKSVFMPQPRGRGGWIESGIGPEVEITVEAAMHAIDTAANFGAEVFFVESGYCGATMRPCTPSTNGCEHGCPM